MDHKSKLQAQIDAMTDISHYKRGFKLSPELVRVVYPNVYTPEAEAYIKAFGNIPEWPPLKVFRNVEIYRTTEERKRIKLSRLEYNAKVSENLAEKYASQARYWREAAKDWRDAADRIR